MMADSKAKTCFKDSPPGNEKTLDLGEKKLNECPAAVADIKGAGLKPREFLVLTAHILGDMMTAELKRGGQIKAYPADTISPENAAFLDQNYDKMKTLLAPMMTAVAISNKLPQVRLHNRRPLIALASAAKLTGSVLAASQSPR